jgi:Protein of unknown function (DUF1573)
MKKIILPLIAALVLPVLVYAQPSIQFGNEVYDLGTVKQGEKVEHVFEFENTGTEDLLITRVHAS